MNVFEIFAKLSLDTSGYDEGLDNSESKASTFGDRLKGGLANAGKIAVGAVTAVAGAATAAGAAFWKGTSDLAAYGDNIDKMSQKMGMSASSYQEWDAILQHSGTSIESMKTGMKTLAAAAETGSDAFEALGLSQEEIAGMSQEELFGATITALQNVESETQRTYLASKLLGKGGTELGALLNTSAEDTEKMRKRVHELGGVMSDEAVKSAAAFQDSLQDMTTAFSGVKRGIMSEFMPSITQVMDGLTEIFAGNGEGGMEMLKEGISSFLTNLQEAVPKVIEAGGMILESLYQAILENLPQIAEGGTQLIVQLVIAITESLPSLVEAGITMIVTIAKTLWDSMPQILEAGKGAVQSLVGGMDPAELITKAGQLLTSFLQTALSYLPQLMDAGISFVGKMAQGVQNNLPQIMQALTDILRNLLTLIMQNLPEFLQKGLELIMSMAEGIIQNLPTIVTSMTQTLVQLIATIAENLPEFLAKGIELLAQLAAGIIQAIPQLVGQIPQVISGIVDAFGSYDWGSIGWNLIQGIGQGIYNAAGDLVNAAINVVADAWNSMTSWLGIASPSKKAEKFLGRYWAEGIGKGFEEYMPVDDMVGVIDDAFEDIGDHMAVPEFADSTSYTVDTEGSRAGTFAPVINVYGAEGQDVSDLADIVMERMTFLYEREGAAYGIA